MYSVKYFYITKLLNALEKETEASTLWAKPHELAKSAWTDECTQLVKEAGRLRRGCRTPADWKAYIRACDRKGKVLRRHKREEFRRAMQESETTSKKLFHSAKWARNAVTGKLTQTIIPPLSGCEGIATTTTQKAEIMFETHFPPPPEVSMDDTVGFEYPEPIQENNAITEREVTRTVHKAAPDKAPGINGESNRALRQLVRVAPTQVQSLFERCLSEGVQPAHFKKAATILLRKPDKKDYTNPKA